MSTDRATRAETLRTELEALASHARQRDARALRTVIEYTSAGMHKDFEGFSGVFEWLRECFDFTHTTASQIARIARLAPKFKALAQAATDGTARIDAVAYAMLALNKKGLMVYSRAPIATGPVESPYDPQVRCATPEELIREHCRHASHAELRDQIDQIAANLFDEVALLDDLSQQTLAHLEVTERPDGMWEVDGTVTADTGRLFANLLKTAVPPPRQEEADADGVLPNAANRNAEALHQLLAWAGASPDAPTRHGHTATLNVTVDVETLQGKDTGRVARLEGRPIPVAKARLLACEAGIIPMVYDYATGEVIEQGAHLRVPNVFLRRKLEAEQPEGCAWSGCRLPVAWCEAHHLIHWADGGPTTPENMILLCRFHHGRIHTGKWEIEKTGPGKAVIRHRDCTDARPCRWCPACRESGRTRADVVDLLDSYPRGLNRDEISPTYRRELDAYAQWAADQAIEAALEAKARAKARFRAESGEAAQASESLPVEEQQTTAPVRVPVPAAPETPILGERHSALDPIPFLRCPRRDAGGGSAAIRAQPEAR